MTLILQIQLNINIFYRNQAHNNDKKVESNVRRVIKHHISAVRFGKQVKRILQQMAPCQRHRH